ncbi:hypothetical protein B0H11DRAFT_2185790 [Mycena galericulata]|nr:hypothetical protein B0H11DRAFT_2185790 [Mycena galericulata]
MENLLPLVSAAFIPFIPSNFLRVVALVVVIFSFTAHVVHHNSTTCQVDRLDTSVNKMEEVFDMAVNECTRDPRFVYEAGLKLTEWASSSLRTRTIDTNEIPWKMYLHHLRGLTLAIKECWADLEDLRASILVKELGLESARRQKYKEGISQKKATLNQNFPAVDGQRFIRMRRPASGILYWRSVRGNEQDQLL